MQKLTTRLSPRDQALFDRLSEVEAKAFFDYLFSVPKKPDGTPKLRSRVIGLYDPFCDRRLHPLGILWQAAPYSFCNHQCVYCYGRSYLHQFGGGARAKNGFRRSFDRCLVVMKELGLPPRHLSMANSTDVLQSQLERSHRHTLYMLGRLREYHDLFPSFGILTKNPGILLEDPGYVTAILDLNAELQVSIAFFRDSAGKLMEPGAAPVSERRRAVEKLVRLGVPVALRIDPLFPRRVTGCREYQDLNEDLVLLTQWAGKVGVSYVISSPLKLVYRRNVVREFNQSLIKAFPEVRRNYRRMPRELQRKLMGDLQGLCDKAELPLQHCFTNILHRNSFA